MGAGEGTGLEEGKGQAVNIVEGEPVEGGQHGRESTEKILNVVAWTGRGGGREGGRGRGREGRRGKTRKGREACHDGEREGGREGGREGQIPE